MFSFKILIFFFIFQVIICDNQNDNMQGDNSFILYTDVKPTNRFVESYDCIKNNAVIHKF